MQVIGMRVLVALDELPTASAGGIVLPETLARAHREKAEQGVVLQVGPGCLNRKGVPIRPEVEVGDRVLVKRFMGDEFVVNGHRGAFVNGDPRDPKQYGFLAVLT